MEDKDGNPAPLPKFAKLGTQKSSTKDKKKSAQTLKFDPFKISTWKQLFSDFKVINDLSNGRFDTINAFKPEKGIIFPKKQTVLSIQNFAFYVCVAFCFLLVCFVCVFTKKKKKTLNST